ncbi:glutathione S-transferase N-terminal domain-containing protein [Amylibacter sp.]|nr:glutathione S-transferase N-terminal domain-containing protein [Amylibacter sp.]MDB2600230.1 glutathione S-transferase N-terminal domain-containing protein [Amylibacter sp.]
MKIPILYSFRRCPYAMRARLAISLSGIKVELREVVLREKPRQMLELSPKGTVPVLVCHDDQVIDESFDIMIWALGNDFFKIEECELVKHCDENFKPWLDRYKYPNKYNDNTQEFVLENAMNFLELLEKKLEKNIFLFGNNRGFADIGIAPFIRQFAHVDIEWFLSLKYPKLINWYKEFVDWHVFKSIMEKNPKWADNQPIVFFP